MCHRECSVGFNIDLHYLIQILLQYFVKTAYNHSMTDVVNVMVQLEEVEVCELKPKVWSNDQSWLCFHQEAVRTDYDSRTYEPVRMSCKGQVRHLEWSRECVMMRTDYPPRGIVLEEWGQVVPLQRHWKSQGVFGLELRYIWVRPSLGLYRWVSRVL